jgi:hypothetical protein
MILGLPSMNTQDTLGPDTGVRIWTFLHTIYHTDGTIWSLACSSVAAGSVAMAAATRS